MKFEGKRIHSLLGSPGGVMISRAWDANWSRLRGLTRALSMYCVTSLLQRKCKDCAAGFRRQRVVPGLTPQPRLGKEEQAMSLIELMLVPTDALLSRTA